MENKSSEQTKSNLNCKQNATSVSQIQAIFESGDITDCSGCSCFIYRNGICGCSHLNH